MLESRLTESIQRDLLRDEVIDEFRSRLGRALRQRDPTEGKRQELEHELRNIGEVIGKGLLSPPFRRACRRQNANSRPCLPAGGAWST